MKKKNKMYVYSKEQVPLHSNLNDLNFEKYGITFWPSINTNYKISLFRIKEDEDYKVKTTSTITTKEANDLIDDLKKKEGLYYANISELYDDFQILTSPYYKINGKKSSLYYFIEDEGLYFETEFPPITKKINKYSTGIVNIEFSREKGDFIFKDGIYLLKSNSHKFFEDEEYYIDSYHELYDLYVPLNLYPVSNKSYFKLDSHSRYAVKLKKNKEDEEENLNFYELDEKKFKEEQTHGYEITSIRRLNKDEICELKNYTKNVNLSRILDFYSSCKDYRERVFYINTQKEINKENLDSIINCDFSILPNKTSCGYVKLKNCNYKEYGFTYEIEKIEHFYDDYKQKHKKFLNKLDDMLIWIKELSGISYFNNVKLYCSNDAFAFENCSFDQNEKVIGERYDPYNSCFTIRKQEDSKFIVTLKKDREDEDEFLCKVIGIEVLE